MCAREYGGVCVFVTASTVIMWTFVAVHCALALAIRSNSIFHKAARQNEGPIKKKIEREVKQIQNENWPYNGNCQVDDNVDIDIKRRNGWGQRPRTQDGRQSTN